MYGVAIVYLWGSFASWLSCVRFWKGEVRDRIKIIMLMRLFQPFQKGTFWYTALLAVPILLVLLYAALTNRDLHYLFILTMLSLSLAFMYTTPPVVVFLGVSSRSSKRLRSRIGWVTPGEPMALLRSSQYSPLSSMRSTGSMWRTIVRGLTTITGLIVVDARSESAYLVEEIHELLAQNRAYKTVFVIGDDGSQPLLDKIDPNGKLITGSGAIVVSEKDAVETVQNYTKSQDTLPRSNTTTDHSV